MQRLLSIIFMFSLTCWSNTVLSLSYVDGLHFMKSPELIIERQDILIDPDQITVSYLIKNSAPTDITQTLVFTSPTQNQFNLSVNDQPVAYNIMQRAISNNGVDITNILKNLGVAFDPIKAMQSIDSSPNHDSLRNKLITLKIMDAKDETPKWSAKTFYYWQQNFPAKSNTLIKHKYKPIVTAKTMKVKSISEFIRMPVTLVKKLLLQNDSAAENLQTRLEKYNPEIAAFCPKKQDYLQILGGSNFTNKDQLILSKELNYNSQQDDIWATPVNHFSLTIESPANMHPLLCWNENLKRKSSNTVFFETENFIPLQNINVLFVQRLGDASGVKLTDGN